MKNLPIATVLLLSALCTTAQSTDAVLSRYLDFLGGKQKLQSITTRIDTGTYNYGGIEFPFISYAKSPDRYKYTVTFKGKYFTQAFDGKTGWRIDVFKNEKTKTLLHGDSARAMANEADVSITPPFLDYKQKGYTATFEGADTAAGQPCYKIKLQTKPTDSALFFFDQQTGALLKKIALSKNSELRGSTLETTYSDYTDIQGLKIPLKTIHRIKDQTVLTITLRSITLNPPIADDSFTP